MHPDPAGGPETTVPQHHPGGVGREAAPPPIRAGRYRLVEELARGGMGIVYRAFDPEMARALAVKLLYPDEDPSGPAARRFEQEARITGRLQHPGIVPVYELGHGPGGEPFIAMKL